MCGTFIAAVLVSVCLVRGLRQNPKSKRCTAVSGVVAGAACTVLLVVLLSISAALAFNGEQVSPTGTSVAYIGRQSGLQPPDSYHMYTYQNIFWCGPYEGEVSALFMDPHLADYA